MEYVELIDTLLQGEIKDIQPASLQLAMSYSLFSGGKRLRGQLCMAAANLFSDFPLPALPFAAAIESIHTYSLIHDDLPALDNDDCRRGQLTSHKKFNEATAILAGDALLNLAYEIMLKSSILGKEREILSASYIARKAGALGMIAGQMRDLENEETIISPAALFQMYEEKTAGLWMASLVAGGIMGGATEEAVFILEKIGKALGIAYQIQDDILEQTTHGDILGKSSESDDKNKKQTAVTFWGLGKARQQYELLWAEINELCHVLDKEPSQFRDILAVISARNF